MRGTPGRCANAGVERVLRLLKWGEDSGPVRRGHTDYRAVRNVPRLAERESNPHGVKIQYTGIGDAAQTIIFVHSLTEDRSGEQLFDVDNDFYVHPETRRHGICFSVAS